MMPLVRADSQPALDDRRVCREGSGLTAEGRCLAAARGELPYLANKRYEPVPDAQKRCEGYQPIAADPDQRSGSRPDDRIGYWRPRSEDH